MMKVSAQHDDKGKLYALIAFDGPENAGMALADEAGRTITELPGVKLKSPIDPEELRVLATGHTLDSKIPHGKQ